MDEWRRRMPTPHLATSIPHYHALDFGRTMPLRHPPTTVHARPNITSSPQTFLPFSHTLGHRLPTLWQAESCRSLHPLPHFPLHKYRLLLKKAMQELKTWRRSDGKRRIIAGCSLKEKVTNSTCYWSNSNIKGTCLQHLDFWLFLLQRVQTRQQTGSPPYFVFTLLHISLYF